VTSNYTNACGNVDTNNCPPTHVTNSLALTVLSNWWTASVGSYTNSGTGLSASFTPTNGGSGSVTFNTAYVNQTPCSTNTQTASATFSFNVSTNCLLSLKTTNCQVEGLARLTNGVITTNVCIGTAVTASVSQVLSNAQIVITSSYTNACGNVDTNLCPPTKETNNVAPTIVSNWWTVAGPGTYSNSGIGLSASFTPTNGGSGTVTFNSKFKCQSPCNTNEQTATPVSLAFNVIQITNECVATTPTNRTRLTIGVAEEVSLSLVGAPAGTFTWSTSAGSVNPTNGTSTTLTAPSNAATATVTVNYGGGSCQLAFGVIAPSGYYASNVTAITGIGTNVAGAGMFVPLWLTSSNVSFYRLEIREVPATNNINVTGYFADTNIWPRGFPLHDAAAGAGGWVPIGMDNTIGTDQAQGSGLPTPWSAGTVTWPIPAQWKVVGSTNTNALTWSNQAFSIDTNGTVTITKFGHTVTRNTNNVYTTVN